MFGKLLKSVSWQVRAETPTEPEVEPGLQKTSLEPGGENTCFLLHPLRPGYAGSMVRSLRGCWRGRIFSPCIATFRCAAF